MISDEDAQKIARALNGVEQRALIQFRLEQNDVDHERFDANDTELHDKVIDVANTVAVLASSIKDEVSIRRSASKWIFGIVATVVVALILSGLRTVGVL